MKRPIKYGFFCLIGYIGYYLIMKALGFNQTLELRIFNFVILTAGIFYGVKELRDDPNREFNYFTSFGLGMQITAFSVIPFALLFYIYLNYANPDFLQAINARDNFGLQISAAFGAFMVMMEGLASGFLSCYLVMQYHKRALEGPENKAYYGSSKSSDSQQSNMVHS